MFTSMMRKYMFARQNCYINASIFSIITYGKNYIFQDYYYQNVTGKSPNFLLLKEYAATG